MIAGQDIVGFILQGEDISGEPYRKDDFDLLKAISTEAANRIKSIHLAQELLRAKEAEAFHHVSTFFIHDMKNFVSTLSLLVQNARVHIKDPLFQEDALNTLSRTVEKMKDMITRLVVLSKRLEIHPQTSDINEILEDTLSSLNGNMSLRVIKKFTDLPKVNVDRKQLQKVLLNLVLNAIDASPRDGQIIISTWQQNGEVCFSVKDNGCGITKEFMEKSLFRPFKSTKDNGLGIGLFHCKKIIEAHGGRIEVESEEGKGSEFRVILPLMIEGNEHYGV